MISLFSMFFCISCFQSASDSGCPQPTATQVGTSEGHANAFVPDPMVASGSSVISPASTSLDQYVTAVSLDHLNGHGVLAGKYVDVRNGLKCENRGYNAFSETNLFQYQHADPAFQEAMSYYFGDLYRARLDSLGELQPAQSVIIDAHCRVMDNAKFVHGIRGVSDYVCLGDSKATPGASYADDAEVTVHELEHATTVYTYINTGELNQFFYDEAGALNEAISDFMSLAFFDPDVVQPFDPRLFSRWALGTFVPGGNNTRGGNRCPTYDSSFPNCGGFPSFAASSQATHISYVYPDGLGWPYANNYQGPGYAQSAYLNFEQQEEIHNAGTLMVGALWDVYSAIKANHSGDANGAQNTTMKLVLEALKHEPWPGATNKSPVTFRNYAASIVTAAGTLSLSSADQSSVSQALTARGLVGGTLLDGNWLAVGPGKVISNGVIAAPGMRVLDDPGTLKEWIFWELGADPTVVPQSIDTINNQLDPNEVVAIWFDIKNLEAQTAGGVLLNVTSLSPDITFLGINYNYGYISTSQAQVMYGKINGTAIVSALTSPDSAYKIPTGNTYFETNPYFDSTWTTALWIQVSPSAAHGETVQFKVDSLPSNSTGVVSSTVFQAKVN